ncbi:MAG: hypothetical protein A2418_01705 [Candidatus Brennerbacteria bacterium RIFOXYC1_FULL_41_11]|nr:MAG: hypothetical protein A2391_03210 [Candidatus Brennerbacteria bacterium RIFOXYB1_FULL_41_13]OGY38954.1 MAG: hypothetical protein A2418_01705 [Candidatus Brennerbacteria bacterium RIFOXYC1_FULL_41_11]
MFRTIPESLTRFGKTLLISAFFALFLLPETARGYAYETHGFLTKQTIEFYNSYFSEKVPVDLVNFVIDASRREDDSPRWINHFYDPVYQRGYQPDIAIDSYPLAFAQILEKVVNWVSSKQWASDSSQQNRLVYKATADIYPVASILSGAEKTKLDIDSETDFSWTAAKQYWLKGEKQKAMFALGHVLHLIQDASVPDHTRNDGHVGDSVYENWTSKFNLANPDHSLSQGLNSNSPVILSGLWDYFDGMAKYSNNNFYSKDTIGVQSGYQNPQPIEYELLGDYYYGLNKDESGWFPILLKTSRKGSVMFGSEYSFTIRDETINNNSWLRLSTKSIQYGAGVINLFFEEVKNEQLKEQDLPWYQRLWSWLVQQRNSLLGGQILPPAQDQGFGDSGSGFSSLFEGLKSVLPSPLAGDVSPALSVLGEETAESEADFASPVPSPTSLSSPIPSPQFWNAQTPNLPSSGSGQSGSAQSSPTPEITPSPLPEASLSPSPVEEPSPSPEPSLSPELSPSPTQDLPRVNYQSSNNQFFSDVAWYFNTDLETEKGGVLTIELTISYLFSGYDYHAIVAGWNSDFVLSDGEKQQGGERPILRYNIATSTSLIIDQTAQDYGIANTLWNLDGDPSATSSGEFPKQIKAWPTTMMTGSYVLVPENLEVGITREAIEQKLGRQIGKNDFITLAYWPLYNNSTPIPDNVRYYPSFLENESEALVLPKPYPVNQVKQLRWGADPDYEGAYTGYSVEFEYVMPVQEISDPNTYGTEIRFHLNQEAGRYFDFDPHLHEAWFAANGAQNLAYVNYGFYGSETCDYWAREEPKSGMRFVYDGCNLTGFKRAAYQYNHLPHVEYPTSSSWIIKLPILSDVLSEPTSELDENDFLTVSLWSYETGSNSGLYLRQIDSRKFYFEPSYQALRLSVSPSPEPSPQPQASNSVVINEIAWVGTASSTSDEWLEIFNNSESNVELTGWILRSVSGSPNIKLSGVIPSGGYYLLERTDDSTVSDIPADLIFTGAINNVCEVFELVDSFGRVVDKTVCDAGQWPAGDNATKSSMERINPDVSGEELSNWQVNNGVVKNGHDVGGNEINGTPKAENSGLL